jgi:hypothetical protein
MHIGLMLTLVKHSPCEDGIWSLTGCPLSYKVTARKGFPAYLAVSVPGDILIRAFPYPNDVAASEHPINTVMHMKSDINKILIDLERIIVRAADYLIVSSEGNCPPSRLPTFSTKGSAQLH